MQLQTSQGTISTLWKINICCEKHGLAIFISEILPLPQKPELTEKTRASFPGSWHRDTGAGRRCEGSGERSGVSYHTGAGGRQHGCGKGSREVRLSVGQYADTVHGLLPRSLRLLLLLRNTTRDNVSSWQRVLNGCYRSRLVFFCAKLHSKNICFSGGLGLESSRISTGFVIIDIALVNES